MAMYEIRQYRESDLKGVLSSYKNASRMAHPFLSDDFIAKVMKDIPVKYLPIADTWVANVDDEVVGFISLIGNMIGALFVQPPYHGRGIGKALMDKAAELHDELEVHVFTENSTGRKFYSNYGFQLVEEQIHEETGQKEFILKFSSKGREYEV
jgi:putative acetyltransferase